MPDHLAGGRVIGPYTEAMPGALQFGIPRVGRFLVRDGATIDVWIAPEADRSAVRQILLDGALGTLIHQRGELALPAVTLISPSGAGVALCGSSAIGKSTLAATLGRRGWLLLADGVVRISANSSGGVVWPGDPRLRLWRDACEALSLNIDDLEPVRQNSQKYFVSVPASGVPTPLEYAVRLQASKSCSVVELTLGQRPELFFVSTFRPRQLAVLGQGDTHARLVDQVSRSCRAMVLEGARDCPVQELADVLSRVVT
jgi:hypothetical protein